VVDLLDAHSFHIAFLREFGRSLIGNAHFSLICF
jgi:hypothetical protein